jgi:hypothetical protein
VVAGASSEGERGHLPGVKTGATCKRPFGIDDRPLGGIGPATILFQRILLGMNDLSPWRSWRTEFERAVARPEPAPGPLDEVPARLRASLSRSLARFQIGEAGEGRIAHQIDFAELPGIDADYRASLKLLVREEGRHGRILARLVAGLEGKLLRATWTERLFVHGRRLAGVRLKLLVLLAAEVIGIGFYGLLAERLPGGALSETLREICADETRHLGFHCAFFRVQTRRGAGRLIFRITWWVVASLACCAVLADHRGTLAVLGLPLRIAAGKFLALIAIADRRVTRSGRLPAGAEARGAA